MWDVCVTGAVFFSTYESLSVRMLVSVVQVRTAYWCAMTDRSVSAHSSISAHPDANISTARKKSVDSPVCSMCQCRERRRMRVCWPSDVDMSGKMTSLHGQQRHRRQLTVEMIRIIKNYEPIFIDIAWLWDVIPRSLLTLTVDISVGLAYVRHNTILPTYRPKKWRPSTQNEVNKADVILSL